MPLTTHVSNYYAARAPEYDRTAGYLHAGARKAREQIRARFQTLLTGHNVLEVACGTGYWTKYVAETAKSILAVDINPGMLDLARRRLTRLRNARLQIADAYRLKDVPGGFTAAFAIWWWSHVPRARLPQFFSALHSKLIPGALVLFLDQLPYASAAKRRHDEDGNLLETRSVQDGRQFEVVKNFPSQQEILGALKGFGRNIVYREYPDEGNWEVAYNVRREPSGGGR